MMSLRPSSLANLIIGLLRISRSAKERHGSVKKKINVAEDDRELSIPSEWDRARGFDILSVEEAITAKLFVARQVMLEPADA